ncbi:MAG: membrane protein insertase YidC [Candidatus Omnitrophota bacterium]
MEKRVILAIVLSMSILFIWNSIFPAPKKPTKETEPVANKEVIEKQRLAPASVAKPVVEKEAKPEETVVLKNEKIEAVFSTKDGIIKKINMVDYDADLPVAGMFTLKEFGGGDYSISKKTDTEVEFSANVDGILIRKTYQLPEGEFIVNAKMEAVNQKGEAVSLNPDISGMILDMEMTEESAGTSRDRNLFEYSAFVDGKVVRKTGAFAFSEKDSKRINKKVEWLGFRNRYFAAIIKPQDEVSGYEFKTVSKQELEMAFLVDEKVLKPGDNAVFSAVIFAGPQKEDILTAYNMDFEKIHVYFGMGFFDAIAKIIEDLMKLFYKIIPNWGFSIIIVSLLIYFLMYPLTMKSMVSMRKMQNLQPKIAEIREKYEKNPQKLNQEIMKIYGENKINPLGGCLPLLFQMPIFIALYQMIWRSVIFKGASFLWIKDLSMPDRLFVLEQNYPVIGNEINLLPMVILALMILQQRMTAKNMVSADPNQIAQQKMMMFVMPAVLLFVFYHLGSGLTLYLTVFYVMSLFTQWQASKIMKTV